MSELVNSPGEQTPAPLVIPEADSPGKNQVSATPAEVAALLAIPANAVGITEAPLSQVLQALAEVRGIAANALLLAAVKQNESQILDLRGERDRVNKRFDELQQQNITLITNNAVLKERLTTQATTSSSNVIMATIGGIALGIAAPFAIQSPGFPSYSATILSALLLFVGLLPLLFRKREAK